MATPQQDPQYAYAGPLSAPYVRKSKQLAEALKAMETETKDIRSPWELAARLGAVAITDSERRKTDAKLKEAQKQDQDNETKAILAGLGAALDGEPRPSAPDYTPDTDRAIADAVTAELDGKPRPPIFGAPRSRAPISEAPLAPARPAGLPPEDQDALARIVLTEAGGESDEGQQAVAAVIANRAKQAGMEIRDVINAPGQFEPVTNGKAAKVAPDTPAYRRALANALMGVSGSAALPPEIAGADHFYSPKAQAALGRQPPAWDNGSGADLGNHRFFSLGYGGQPAGRPNIGAIDPSVAMTGGINPDAPQPSMQLPTGQEQQLSMPELARPQGDAQPYQVASNGPTPPPPQGQAGNPNAPTQQQIQLIKSWMESGDPAKQKVAREYALKLQQQMAQRPEYELRETNGAQVYYPKTPGFGAPQAAPMPQEARTKLMSAEQLGIRGAAPGTMYAVNAAGTPTQAYAPPQGYGNTGQGADLAPIRGGPQDPYAPQKPPSGYEMRGQRMAPIEGGPQDPQGSEVQRQAVLQYHSQFKPIVEMATKFARNYAGVNVGYRQQDGAGDIAMINGLQRMIDEGVVREGDVSLQLKGQGIQGGLAQLKGYLSSKGFFDSAIRDRIKSVADGLNDEVSPQYREQVMAYAPEIDATYGAGTFNKIVPSQIAKQLGWTREPEAAQRGASASEAAQRAGIPPPDQRPRGKVYNTPKGVMRWTGTGWVQP